MDENLQRNAENMEEFSSEIQKKSRTISALIEEKEKLLKEKAVSENEKSRLQKIIYGKTNKQEKK